MGLFRRRQQHQQQPPSPPPPSGVVVDELLGDADARRVRAALEARDWTTAREILTGAPSVEHLGKYVALAANTKGVQDWIDGPVRDDPSALALLVKGARYVYWAWDARGEGLADTVGGDTWKVWFTRLKVAEDCLDEALEREPSTVEAWHWLIVLARARQVPLEELWRRFDGLVALEPTHYLGHSQMLNGLMAKWSGSTELMFSFARDRAKACPATSVPVLVAEAHLEHRFAEGRNTYMERADVGDEVVAAAHQSIWHPDYRRTFLTPEVVNTFAYAFAYADRFAEAERLFQEIGDDGVTPDPWRHDKGGAEQSYVRLRAYVRSKLGGAS
jgi:hypothetical protein